MLDSFLFGIFGLISFIHTNNSLLRKHYNEQNNKNGWRVTKNDNKILINESIWNIFFLSNIKKYSDLQKRHYIQTMIMFVIVTAMSMETYKYGYTQLHLNHYKLIYFPIDIFVSFFINGTVFYFYHIFAHTKYMYKYIHSYHHAFIKPEPFDSLVGHPLDHFGSGICQIIPMFIYPMHLLSFMTYSSILSLLGIYDHSGVYFKFFKYDTIDHHIHHAYPTKNYGAGYAFMCWDRLFGTYKAKM